MLIKYLLIARTGVRQFAFVLMSFTLLKMLYFIHIATPLFETEMEKFGGSIIKILLIIMAIGLWQPIFNGYVLARLRDLEEKE